MSDGWCSGTDCLRPCTPAGVQELLLRSGNDPGGKHVVVVGRSNIVGKPVMNILLQKQPGANAVVTIAHTGAADFARFYARPISWWPRSEARKRYRGNAEARMCGHRCRDNRIPDPATKTGTRLVGDVHFASASEVASAITPVPGGVGPMTIAMLMKNTLQAARGEIYH